MRTIKRVVAFICLAITALACEKPAPVIQVKEAVPQLGYMQTIASIRYAVENADGNRISASASHPWIHSFSIGDEVVSFTVDENNTGGPRTADIKLEYPGAEPVIVPVLQSWAASGITITPASATAAYTGGQGSFSFEVGNPRAGVDITISSESDWITNISKTENFVSYTVLENNSGKARSGIIVLKYGSFATAEFSITQAWTASMIVLTPASAEVDYSGGQGALTFAVENPRVGVDVTASSDSPWITNVVKNGDTVSYSVQENNSGASRTGKIILEYGTYAAAEYTINQAWAAANIVISPESTELDYIGGTGSFSFTIENPRAETEVTVSCDCPWITNVTKVGNMVSYSVAENESGKQRTGEMLLSYGIYASATYAVAQNGIPATSISLNKTATSLLVGESEQLSVTSVSPADADIVWSSSDSMIASVSANGLVTALSDGSAIISVCTTSGGASASCAVTVVNNYGGINEGIGEIIWK